MADADVRAMQQLSRRDGIYYTREECGDCDGCDLREECADPLVFFSAEYVFWVDGIRYDPLGGTVRRNPIAYARRDHLCNFDCHASQYLPGGAARMRCDQPLTDEEAGQWTRTGIPPEYPQ